MNLASVLFGQQQHTPIALPENALGALLRGQTSMPMTLPEILMYQRQMAVNRRPTPTYGIRG